MSSIQPDSPVVDPYYAASFGHGLVLVWRHPVQGYRVVVDGDLLDGDHHPIEARRIADLITAAAQYADDHNKKRVES